MQPGNLSLLQSYLIIKCVQTNKIVRKQTNKGLWANNNKEEHPAPLFPIHPGVPRIYILKCVHAY